MDKTCENCDRTESCAGNDTGVFPCSYFVPKDCLLTKVDLILVPYDPGRPPAWTHSLKGAEIHWVKRRLFNKLKLVRYKKPCNICPEFLKSKCEVCSE